MHYYFNSKHYPLITNQNTNFSDILFKDKVIQSLRSRGQFPLFILDTLYQG